MHKLHNQCQGKHNMKIQEFPREEIEAAAYMECFEIQKLCPGAWQMDPGEAVNEQLLNI